MKTFIITINGEVQTKTHTTLKAACDQAGVVYSTARKGRKYFLKDNGETVVSITKAEVIRNQKAK